MNSTPSPTPRRILMCVSGMSPAVITETLYALVKQAEPFVPDEIHVVTTIDGKKKVLVDLLHPTTGHFHRFMQEHLPGHNIRFDDLTIHVIKQGNEELADITTDAHNKAAADTLYRVMRDIKSVPGTVLHASVAGGRKSMSFYMGHVFSLLAQPQDVLTHVLVTEPFEGVPGFYYPPREPATMAYKDKGTNTIQQANTANAVIQLAELSVLKLGSTLGSDWPMKAQENFDFAVQLAQATFEPPQMKVVFDRERHRGWLEVCGETIKLSPLQFMLFAVHALVRHHETELQNRAAIAFDNLPTLLMNYLEKEMGGKTFDPKEFKPVNSKTNAKLHDAVGAVANHFSIDAVGVKTKGVSRPAQLKAPAHCLTLVGLDHWWAQLKPCLR